MNSEIILDLTVILYRLSQLYKTYQIVSLTELKAMIDLFARFDHTKTGATVKYKVLMNIEGIKSIYMVLFVILLSVILAH